jgi:PAS domain S-box-containing protein
MAIRSPYIRRWEKNVWRVALEGARWITKPAASLEQDLRRRLRLLSAFLLLFTINTIWGSIFLKNAGDNLWIPMAVTSFFCMIGYGFSRTKYHVVATIIAVSFPSFPSLYAFLFSTNQVYTAATLMWLALPLLVSSLLLSLRFMKIIGIIYLVILIVITPFSKIDSSSLAQIFSFIFMIYFLVIVTAAIRRQGQSEIELQFSERLRIEKIVRESEEKFRSLFEYAKDAVVIADAQTGIIIDINPAGCNLLGLPKEKIVGEHQSIIHPPEMSEEYKNIFRQHVEKGRVITEDIILQRADGSQIQTDVSASVIRMGDKTIIQGVFRDITERKQAEKALRESEEKFSKAFNASPQEICITRVKDGKTIEINESFIRFTGYTREDIIGRTSTEMSIWTRPEDRQKMLKILKENGRVHNEEYEFRIKSGENRTQLFSAEPIVLNGEECIISIMTDITERKRMENALANEATRRRILIEQSRDGIVILDQNGDVFEANRRFAEMLGYSHEESLKLHVWDWDTQWTQEQLLEMINTVTEAGDHFETYHQRKDGTTFDVEISTNGATFGGQKLVFCVCRDITERKRMEKALKESEEKFSIAFRASPEDISISSLKDGAFIDVNDSYVASTGYTREELIGHNANDFNMWTDDEQRDRMVQNIQKRIKMHNEEFQFRTKSGEVRTNLISSEFINVGDEPCVLIVSTDITERKVAEEVLKERERRFSDIAENALEWIWEVDAEGKYTYSSPVVEKILGYKPEEMLEHHFYDFFLPEEREELKKAAFEAFARKQTIKDLVNKNRRKDGKTVELMTSGVPVIDEAGNLVGYRGVDTDITERKKAEEALKTNEERFRLITDNSTDLISRIQAIPTIKTDYVSPSCFRITGYKQEEFYANPNLGLQMIHPEDREFFQKIVDFNKKSRQKPITVRLVRKDGRIVWIEQTHTIIRNERGVPVAVHLIAHDITERRLSEQALKESEEKFSMAFRSSPEMIAIANMRTGQYTEVNDSYLNTTGYSREEIVGHPVNEVMMFVDPNDSEKMAELLTKNGIVRNEEYSFRMKSGEIRTWLCSAEIITIGGDPCIISVATDITERKRAEEALKESEEKFSRAFNASPQEIVITRASDNLTLEVNESFTRHTGFTREEAIGRTASKLGVWLNQEDNERMMRMLAEQGRVYNEEFHYRNKSGGQNTQLVSIEPIVIGGEKCWISIMTDITERKRAEKLQQDENLVLTLLGQGAELNELLDGIARLGESHDPGIKGSVLLFDPVKELLIQAAGPSLPDDFRKLFEKGIPIGPNMGTCGTAAYLKKRVIVTDIENSPLFPHEEVVKEMIKNGLRACWSQPILMSNGDVLGTIANYSSKKGKPDEGNLRVLEWSAHIAAIAIERKQAEEILKESEEFTHNLLENAPNPVIVINPDTSIKYVNPAFEKLTGFKLDEIAGIKMPHPWWREGDKEEISLSMEKTLASGGMKLERTFRSKTGEDFWVEMHLVPIIYNKIVKYHMANWVDITERKKTEETLLFSDAAFKSIHESVIVTNVNGEITHWNEISEQLFGLKASEVMGRKFLKVIEVVETYPGESQDRIKKIHNQGHWEEERLYHTKRGDIWVDVHLQDIVGNGKQYGRVMLASDITQRKQAEAELKQALSEIEESSARLAATNKELEAFSYSVSHDLRSPLRSIDGFSQALLEDYQEKLDDKGQDYLNRLRGASQKMGELIDGLLKLSRLTRSEMHLETVDMSALAEEITARLQETQPERRVKFVIDKGLAVNGDPQLLRALLENLLGNAWKFTSKNPKAKIEFSLDHNGDKKAYFIKDNGAGFDMNYAEKLFSVFQRLHDISEFPGTGIGLATVQRIINRHGGTIRAEGAVGKGATFYFTLN